MSLPVDTTTHGGNLPLSKRNQEELRLELEIKAAHTRTMRIYGPERLQHDLAEHVVRVGFCRIKRIRKKLRCKQKRKFKVTNEIFYPEIQKVIEYQFSKPQEIEPDKPNQAGCSCKLLFLQAETAFHILIEGKYFIL